MKYRKKMKIMAAMTAVMIFFGGCGARTERVPEKEEVLATEEQAPLEEQAPSEKQEPVGEQSATEENPPQAATFIDPAGETLQERFRVPPGYERTDAGKDSLASFLREYPLKEDGSPVLLYDGSEKGNQSAHTAVFRLPLENEDLQQCADSVMRVYGEYYYSHQEYEKIRYAMGGGFTADFSEWSRGHGIAFDGAKLYWTAQPSNDSSYESFQRFMRMVFAYSGTLNLEQSSQTIALEEISVGDMFIRGGSPGHVVMAVDLCRDADGRKAFLLAQGYMPAQEFHVLKNPLHEEDPWYYEQEISYPLLTPECTFEEGSLRRPDLAED